LASINSEVIDWT